MYSLLKNLLIRLFPKFLYKFEHSIRKLISIFYLGNKVYCEVCNKNFRKFIHYKTRDKICPSCGSLGRHRRLYSLIKQIKIGEEDKILHFSPSKTLQKCFKRSYSNYTSTDYNSNLQTDKNYNITSIDCSDNYYDLIICYHILEHIPDDIKAIQELFRVLKPHGKLIVQTPFKDGGIYEDFSITNPKERLIHFGQEDHVRIYSVNGLKQRLETVFETIEIKEFTNETNNKNGYSTTETIIICTKVL